MFEGLDWKSAAKRSAVVVGIYLALFYVLGTAFPRQFPLNESGQVAALLINAVMFFFVFTLVYAFLGRSRERRMQALRDKEKAEKAARAEATGDGDLKGRANPNTARKKTRRRR